MERRKEPVSLCRDRGICPAYLFGSKAREGLGILEGETIDLDDDPLADPDPGAVFNFSLPPTGGIPELYSKLYNFLSDLFLPLPLDPVLLQEQHSVFQANAGGVPGGALS